MNFAISGSNPVTISIVTHKHGERVSQLSKVLVNYLDISRIIITKNVPDQVRYLDDLKLQINNNPKPTGFAKNHNIGFTHAATQYFCVLNPDIHLKENPFPDLLSSFSNPKVALVAPKIITPEGQVEDSARKFPTLRSLACKAFGGSNGTYPELNSSPDWVGGMFMLFRSDVFREIGGFDEKFFLYYEDVDICWRLRQKGYEIKLVPSVEVIHDARRESRKNWRYARWHLASMARYLIKARACW
jgi:GT2 family glycosyltransferase